ncbi:MAG: type II toxin-antitoxin system RelE/ParE family toxin [Bacteroidetes bacterium]|nr:type II toxin-antitoxin system RelE/ParE family toxin [Bacteroidota bacterium]
MTYNIFALPPFEKQLKRLVKKYPSLKKEYAELLVSLEKSPEQGTKLGNNCYKIRIAIASKGRGKSGGARLITTLVIKDKIVYLLALYDKSEIASISDSELKALLSFIPKQ